MNSVGMLKRSLIEYLKGNRRRWLEKAYFGFFSEKGQNFNIILYPGTG